MLKKIISLSLALCMILSLAAIVPVSATSTTTYYDNFDSTVGTVASTGKSYTGDAFVSNSKAVGNTLSIATGAGVSGDALKFTATSTTESVATMQPVNLTYNATDREYMLATYRVKFNSFPTAVSSTSNTTAWGNFGQFYTSADYVYQSYCALGTQKQLSAIYGGFGYSLTSSSKYGWAGDENGNTQVNLETNKWYTFAFSAWRSAEKVVTVTASILDEQGKVLFKGTAATSSMKNTAPVYFSPIYIDGTTITSGTAEFLLDDCYLYGYKASQAPSVVSALSTISNNATDVAVDSAFTVAFDQSITGTENVTIYRAGDSSNPIAATLTNVGVDRFTITPDADLDGGTDYVIDMTSVTNGTTASTETIAFTTAGGQTTTGTSIRVDGEPYTVTKSGNEDPEDLIEIPNCKPEGTVGSLSMTVGGEPVTVAKNAWMVDTTSGALKISNSLITEGAVFITSEVAPDAREVSVQTVKVGANAAQSSLYMLGKITGVPTKYGVRLECSDADLSDDYDAAGTNERGEFLVELGYGSKLPTDTYSLTAYADNETGLTGTVTITE